MNIQCRYCNAKIPLKIKLGSEDYPKDELNQQLENMQGGVAVDKSYNPKQDRVDKEWQLLDRGTKKYKIRTDRPMGPSQTDMEGVSNIAVKINDYLIVKCGECGNTYAGIYDPSSSVYNQDTYWDNPASPRAYMNETHEDNEKVHSGTKIPEEQIVNLDKIINKVKKRKKEHSNAENNEF